MAKQQVALLLRSHVMINEQDAQTLTMPAYLAEDKVLGLKMVSIFPHNVNKQNLDYAELQALDRKPMYMND